MRPVRTALALAFAVLAPLGGLALATAPAGAANGVQLASSAELNADGSVTLSYTITCPSGDTVSVNLGLMQQNKAVENKGGAAVRLVSCTGSAQSESTSVLPNSGSTFRTGWAIGDGTWTDITASGAPNAITGGVRLSH